MCAVVKKVNRGVDSTAVSVFVVIVVELTNTVFVNSTNINTNIETAKLSTVVLKLFFCEYDWWWC